MKQYMLTTVLLLSIVLITCKKEEVTEPQRIIASGIMKATINDSAWSAGGNPTGGPSAAAIFSNGLLTISGTRYDAPLTTGKRIAISVRAFGNGTFSLGDENAIASAAYIINTPPIRVYTTDGIFSTGSITLTKVDKTNRIIAGTFFFGTENLSHTNLLAGTSGGVFLSTNNGTSWTARNTGLTNTSVEAVVVSGTNLFAGTYGGGVFLSTNNGTSWTAVNTGLTNMTVNALAVSPNGAGGINLFAGTYGGGVFLSTNNGTSWTTANNGLTADRVTALAVSGTNLFAGTTCDGAGSGCYGGVFLSTNNGTSWTARYYGLTNYYVYALAVSSNGSGGTNLFAGGFDGVCLSTNNGESWTAVNTGLPNTWVHALAVSGTNLFAGAGNPNRSSDGGGVFLSTNNGTSWKYTGLGLVYALAVSGTNIFAGTYGGGVFLSTNNGTSWTARNTGLNGNMNALVGTPARLDISLFNITNGSFEVELQE